MSETVSGQWVARVDTTLVELQGLVAYLEQRVAELEASAVRQQEQREADLDRLERMLTRLGERLDDQAGGRRW